MTAERRRRYVAAGAGRAPDAAVGSDPLRSCAGRRRVDLCRRPRPGPRDGRQEHARARRLVREHLGERPDRLAPGHDRRRTRTADRRRRAGGRGDRGVDGYENGVWRVFATRWVSGTRRARPARVPARGTAARRRVGGLAGRRGARRRAGGDEADAAVLAGMAQRDRRGSRYAVTGDGKVFVLRREPIVGGNTAFRVVALDPSSGAEKWQSPRLTADEGGVDAHLA